MKATFFLAAEFGYQDKESVECEVLGCTDAVNAMYAVKLPHGWDKEISPFVREDGYCEVCSDYLEFQGDEKEIPMIPSAYQP